MLIDALNHFQTTESEYSWHPNCCFLFLLKVLVQGCSISYQLRTPMSDLIEEIEIP